jgi:hypothetical protein
MSKEDICDYERKEEGDHDEREANAMHQVSDFCIKRDATRRSDLEGKYDIPSKRSTADCMAF